MARRRVYPNLRAYLSDHRDETQTQLAAELGISMAYFSMMKWGTRQPPLQLALKMSERFGIPLESLMLPRHQRRTA